MKNTNIKEKLYNIYLLTFCTLQTIFAIFPYKYDTYSVRDVGSPKKQFFDKNIHQFNPEFAFIILFIACLFVCFKKLYEYRKLNHIINTIMLVCQLGVIMGQPYIFEKKWTPSALTIFEESYINNTLFITNAILSAIIMAMLIANFYIVHNYATNEFAKNI